MQYLSERKKERMPTLNNLEWEGYFMFVKNVAHRLMFCYSAHPGKPCLGSGTLWNRRLVVRTTKDAVEW